MTTWVLVPCHRPRLQDLWDSLVYLGHPAEHTVVVTTHPKPLGPRDVAQAGAVLVYPEPGINISRWWNLGLDYIAGQHAPEEPYEVLCMESDVRVTLETVEVLRRALRAHDLGMVGADWVEAVRGQDVEVRRELTPMPMPHRIPGVCMLVAGELGLRFDDQFRWWYADDDFEWQHRKAKGTGLVRGQMIQHGAGRPLDSQRAAYAAEDVVRFQNKWGSVHIL